MIQFRRIVDRTTFHRGTPGLILGVFFYVLALVVLYKIGNETNTNTAPCLLIQMTGIKCPLCGGTRASLALLQGDFKHAFVTNPLAALLVIVGLVWFILRFCLKIRVTLSLPRPVLICGIVLLVAINWSYVVSHQDIDGQERPPFVRDLLLHRLQR